MDGSSMIRPTSWMSFSQAFDLIGRHMVQRVSKRFRLASLRFPYVFLIGEQVSLEGLESDLFGRLQLDCPLDAFCHDRFPHSPDAPDRIVYERQSPRLLRHRYPGSVVLDHRNVPDGIQAEEILARPQEIVQGETETEIRKFLDVPRGLEIREDAFVLEDLERESLRRAESCCYHPRDRVHELVPSYGRQEDVDMGLDSEVGQQRPGNHFRVEKEGFVSRIAPVSAVRRAS